MREHGCQGTFFSHDGGVRTFRSCFLKSGLNEKTDLKTSREQLFEAESRALANVLRQGSLAYSQGIRKAGGAGTADEGLEELGERRRVMCCGSLQSIPERGSDFYFVVN